MVNDIDFTAEVERTQILEKLSIDICTQRAFFLIIKTFQKRVNSPKGSCWSLGILPEVTWESWSTKDILET